MVSNCEIDDLICELLSNSYLKSLHAHPQGFSALHCRNLELNSFGGFRRADSSSSTWIISSSVCVDVIWSVKRPESEVMYEIFHTLNSGCEIKSAMILAVMNAIYAVAYGSLKKSGLQRGLNPWPRHTEATLQPTEIWSHWRWEMVICRFWWAREEWMWSDIWNISYNTSHSEGKYRYMIWHDLFGMSVKWYMKYGMNVNIYIYI